MKKLLLYVLISLVFTQKFQYKDEKKAWEETYNPQSKKYKNKKRNGNQVTYPGNNSRKWFR